MKSIPKLSSYQKMKQRYEQRISELEQDVYTLIDDKSFLNTTVVKTKYTMKREQENIAWLGNSRLKQ